MNPYHREAESVQYHWHHKFWESSLVAPRDGIEDEHVERAIAILNRE